MNRRDAFKVFLAIFTISFVHRQLAAVDGAFDKRVREIAARDDSDIVDSIRMATGGIAPQRSYVVGERGPELFMPSTRRV